MTLSAGKNEKVYVMSRHLGDVIEFVRVNRLEPSRVVILRDETHLKGIRNKVIWLVQSPFAMLPRNLRGEMTLAQTNNGVTFKFREANEEVDLG